MDIVYARGTCPALDRYGNGMTIDELHDLQDKLCPTRSNRNERGTDPPRVMFQRLREHRDAGVHPSALRADAFGLLALVR